MADDDLGGAVGPTLDVGGEVVRREAAAAEIDEFDFTPGKAFDDDVFGFDVAVDQVQTVHELERLQYLPGDEFQTGDGEVWDLVVLSDEPAELVEIVSKQLRHDEKVFCWWRWWGWWWWWWWGSFRLVWLVMVSFRDGGRR